MGCVMGLVSDKEFLDILLNRFGRDLPGRSGQRVSYLHNYVSLKKYDDDNGNVKYRLICMPTVKEGGIEYDKSDVIRDMLIKCDVRENLITVNDDLSFSYPDYINGEKFESSLIRAKSKIFDLAFCNAWEFFFTGTLNSNSVGDRTDLPRLHKKLTQFIKDFNRLHNCKVKFLIVPETHADGVSWHFHGFLMGFDDFSKYSRKFDLTNYPTMKIKEELLRGFDVFSWLQYERSFGFNTVEPIKNHECVAKYVTKYITKDVLHSVSQVGAHVYYRSRGLRVPSVVKDGFVTKTFIDSFNWDCENEFCKFADVLPDEVDHILTYIDYRKNFEKGFIYE